MNKRAIKLFKSIKNHDSNDNFINTMIESINIYDKNARLVKVFTKDDSDKNESFIIKARKYTKGGKLRIKYNYK